MKSSPEDSLTLRMRIQRLDIWFSSVQYHYHEVSDSVGCLVCRRHKVSFDCDPFTCGRAVLHRIIASFLSILQWLCGQTHQHSLRRNSANCFVQEQFLVRFVMIGSAGQRQTSHSNRHKNVVLTTQTCERLEETPTKRKYTLRETQWHTHIGCGLWMGDEWMGPGANKHVSCAHFYGWRNEILVGLTEHIYLYIQSFRTTNVYAACVLYTNTIFSLHLPNSTHSRNFRFIW